MKTKNILLAALTTSLLFLVAASAKRFVPLFNGKNLSGWTVHGTEKWYVNNGELVCESGASRQYGYLSTDKSYRNFELRYKFKQEANGNSGVFFRSSIQGTSIKGWQVEVAPKGLHTGGIYESGGRGWLAKPQSEDEQVLKENEWNDARVRVVNDEVTTWLNGKQMIHIKDAAIAAGKGVIALQIHSGGGIRVRWKDIVIDEM